jgi:hypothetical protein
MTLVTRRKTREDAMRCWLSVVVVLTVAGSWGCSDSTGIPDEDFRVAPVEDGIQVANESRDDLFFQGLDPDALALWAGPHAATECVEPDCPHVAPGEIVVLPWNEIIGWGKATTRVTVYWWWVVSDREGGWRVEGETIRSREVLLR